MMLLFSNVICLILNEVPLWIGWADMKETDDIITNFEIHNFIRDPVQI